MQNGVDATPQTTSGSALGRVAELPAAARWAIAVAALLAFALAFQGSRPLWEPDEGRYVAVALEMVRSGDWLVPRLHHQYAHFSKPPLTYWALASSMVVFGENEWALRLPNALAFTGTVLLVFGIARRLRPADAPLAALVYATFLLPWAAANIVTTDTLLTLWEALAVWGFVGWWRGREPARRRWLLVMWLGFGLAFLTKGPVGLLPLLAIVAVVGATDGARGLRAVLPAAGLALFAVVGLGWFAVVVLRRPELLDYFVAEELVGRVFSGMHRRNPEWYGPVKVYLPAFLLGALPWTPFLLARPRRWLEVFRLSSWRRWLREDRPLFLLLAWLLLPMLVFAISQSRLHLYVLPLFPALALLTARRLRPRWRWSRGRVLLLAAWLVVLLALRLVAAELPSHRDARAMARQIAELTGEHYDEIVMVGVRNGFGLSFYLGREVEHVALTEADLERGCAHCRQTLAQELAENEQRVFIVDSRRAAVFEDIVKASGREARLAGTAGKLRVYRCPIRLVAPHQTRGRSTPPPRPAAEAESSAQRIAT